MLRYWIEGDPERTKRFFNSSADRRALVAEGITNVVKPFTDAYGAASIAKAGNQGVPVKQTNRTPVSRPDVKSRQAPPVPRSQPRSQANPGNTNTNNGKQQKSNREIQNDLDDRAWALFNEVLQEQGAPE